MNSHPSSSIATTPAELVEILFFKALEIDNDDRSAFLERECAGDENLRREIEGLLQAHVKSGDFFGSGGSSPSAIEHELARLKPEEPGEKIGCYKLLQQIGEGGFGTVWMAEQETPVRRRVALKIIKMGMDTKDVVARFEQERQALAMMEHPNIAQVYDAGCTPFGRPYFVMELVKGVRITEYCDQAQLSTTARLNLFIPVCNAVQHAHLKGIIHRDLKPSNILVTLHDGVPVPKVIDFGVAKATQQQRLTDLTLFTQYEQMIGTPLYMAPEQAELSGLDVDTRSDIYSLGVVLYELLTGRTPFDPQRLMKMGLDEIRRVIREDEPPRPSTFVSTMAIALRTDIAKHRGSEITKIVHSIRGDLDWIIMKALEKDRNRRYETASSFARDIERHLANVPVQARPASAIYRFRRFARRNRAGFLAGMTTAAALLLGGALSVWQAIRANTALNDLRMTAPAFAEQARNLSGKERFKEAAEKLEYAIRLRPDVAEYQLAKADLLQSQFRFVEAARAYQQAASLNPSNRRARDNASLCQELAKEVIAGPRLRRESLARLLAVMRQEGRAPAEMIRVGQLLGEESSVLLRYWLERLKDLPIPPDRPLADRLTLTDSGRLALDLGGAGISDIAALEGMPLERLVLAGCEKIADLSPIRGIALRRLFLGRSSNEMTLGGLRACKNVRDLQPLREMPLEMLDIEGTSVTDLSPLAGMPLEWLNLREIPATNLSPLGGMPLRHLDCSHVPTRDLSFLRGLPLKYLSLRGTDVDDLSILTNTPLETLFIHACPKARKYTALSRMEKLKVLLLPQTVPELPDEELEALQRLHQHPNLVQVQVGHLNDRRSSVATVGSKSTFLVELEEIVRVRRALALLGVSSGRFSKGSSGPWRVNLYGMPLSDITPLQGLPIEDLNLGETNIEDIRPLKGMPLVNLGLAGSKVVDLTPLRGSPISFLNLERTRIKDLAGLEGMALTGLNLELTNIDDLNPLRGAPLNELFISFTKITDLGPLKGMPLQKLFAQNAPITDLSPLAGAPLSELGLPGTGVVNLSPLQGMPLNNLSLANTKVSDLTPLMSSPLKKLILLDGHPGIDLSPLANHSTLEAITLPPSPRNLSSLRSLPKLRFVSFEYDLVTKQVPQTVDEFWRGERPRVPRALAQDGKFVELERLLAKRVSSDTLPEWLILAAAISASGEHDRYKRLCSELVKTFRGYFSESHVAAATALIVLLRAQSGVPEGEIATLIELAQRSDDSMIQPVVLLATGLFEFRYGRHEGALSAFRRIDRERSPAEWASGLAISAMACYRLGDENEARRMLKEAEDLIGAHWPNGPTEAVSWERWFVADLFLRETCKLLAR